MNICVIGTGYVGLVAGTCFAESGNEVICVDSNPAIIEKLEQGKIPIYEPGLEDMVERNTKKGRLSFTTDLIQGVQKSQIIFIAVGTPEGEDGSADLQYVRQVAKEVGQAMNEPKIIVDKSTVPVGTADQVRDIVSQYTEYNFNVVSNPEFMKEGAAVKDFMMPDRVVIGTDSDETAEVMKELYSPFVRTGNPILIMDIRSAELTKYASNAMLATKISFMNQIARLADKVGADIYHVRQGVGSDSRIGFQFLFPGIGYGGSCFPKDVKALIRTGDDDCCDMSILKAVDKLNELQKRILVDKILGRFGEDLTGRTFAVWGLSFKPETDDMREAPSIVTVNGLLRHGAEVRVFDPAAMETSRREFGDRVEYYEKSYDALEGADALVVITEWNEFRNPNFDRIKAQLKTPIIFDGRNLYKPERLKAKGFEYYCVGRPAVTQNIELG